MIHVERVKAVRNRLSAEAVALSAGREGEIADSLTSLCGALTCCTQPALRGQGQDASARRGQASKRQWIGNTLGLRYGSIAACRSVKRLLGWKHGAQRSAKAVGAWWDAGRN